MRNPVYSRIHKTYIVNYKLTILIPTLLSRIDTIKELITELNYQIQNKPVQILWLGDNKSMTVGEKRNLLHNLAKGEYVCFIDDDDFISDNYIDTILSEIDKSPNVICFEGTQTTNGKEDSPFKYDLTAGRNHKSVVDGKKYKIMLPDHLCVWKKSIITEKFPLKSLGEDHDWAKAMAFKITDSDVTYLKDRLYHYEYNKLTSECGR